MAEWPLCGRDREVAHMTALLEDPDVRGLVLLGSAGVGKTRLGHECLRLAEDRGCAVIRVSATYATADLPLGAVILSSPAENIAAVAAGEQAEAVHRVAQDLVRKADGRRLVMLVDDVQWLDQLSAVLVHQMAVTAKAFVVLTARTGVAVPDPIVALWKDGIVERITVAPVSRAAVEGLLTTVLGGPVAGSALANLAERSEGNPLFLRHLVLDGLENGELAQDAGVWHLAAGEGAPPRLVGLVESRLAGLDADERAGLEVIAFGEPLDLGDTVALVDEAVLQQLELKNLVSVRPDGWGGARVLLAHSMFGEVLRAQMSVIRARHITATLADAAERARPTQPDEVLRIATWRLVCGGGAPDLMHDAAKAAYARHDHALAARLAAGAVAAGAGFDARLLLAEAQTLCGHHEEAERDLAVLAAEADGPEQQGKVATARLTNALLKGDQVLSTQVYREALESVTEPQQRDEIRARHVTLVLIQEGPRSALRAGEEVWSDSLTGRAAFHLASIRGIASARSGLVSHALTAVDVGRAAVRHCPPEELDASPVFLDLVACEACAIAGRHDEALRLAEAMYADALRERSAGAQLYAAYQLAKLNLAMGRIRTAVRLSGEAVGIAHQLHDPHLLAASLVTRAEALALCGEVDDATRALAEAETQQQVPWLFAEPAIARAWLAVARADLISARRALEGEVERALACDDLRAASLALHSLVRIGEARLARAGLEDLAGRVEGDLVPLQARHAKAVLDKDGQALEDVAARFADMSAMLLAAEAYSDGAVAFRRDGQARRSGALSQKAAKYLELCEGARTPATQSLEVGADLTQSERRTAMLAGQGMSNKDIAALEFVSIRTVESRLQSIYGKLGISSRTELASHFATD